MITELQWERSRALASTMNPSGFDPTELANFLAGVKADQLDFNPERKSSPPLFDLAGALDQLPALLAGLDPSWVTPSEQGSDGASGLDNTVISPLDFDINDSS
jgi:hypothetical protein